jgi:preprotein translocase subunit YajC
MFDLIAQTAPSVPAPSTPAPMTPTPGATGTETPAVPLTSSSTAPGTPAAKAPPPDAFLLIKQMGPIILMVVVFLLLLNRSKKKESKGRTDMLSNLKKGDEVQTIGGILGKVMDAREDRVLVKVDESSNTKIWFSRTSIHRVVGADEETK